MTNIPQVHPCVIHAFTRLFAALSHPEGKSRINQLRLNCGDSTTLRDRVNLAIMVLAPQSMIHASPHGRTGHWINPTDRTITIFSNSLIEIAARLNRIFNAGPGLMTIPFQRLAGETIPKEWLKPDVEPIRMPLETPVHPCILNAFRTLFLYGVAIKEVSLRCDSIDIRNRIYSAILKLAPVSTADQTHYACEYQKGGTIISINLNCLREIARSLDCNIPASVDPIVLHVTFCALALDSIPVEWSKPQEEIARLQSENAKLRGELKRSTPDDNETEIEKGPLTPVIKKERIEGNR